MLILHFNVLTVRFTVKADDLTRLASASWDTQRRTCDRAEAVEVFRPSRARTSWAARSVCSNDVASYGSRRECQPLFILICYP